MRTNELEYTLPSDLIAQHPPAERDSSRLLIYDRKTGKMQHGNIPDLLGFLAPGDVVVYNDSRVIRARLHTIRKTGGRVELLFLRRRDAGVWEALAKPSGRLRQGEGLYLPAGAALSHPPLRMIERLDAGRWLVRNQSSLDMEAVLEKWGEVPLPPYIRQSLSEPDRYQTVYAAEPGSAAAPTAGLHFTPELMAAIGARGIGLFPLTLHVGLDTFRPVSEEQLDRHEMHTESYCVPEATYEAVRAAKDSGSRIVAVGTTSVRVLETVFREGNGRPPLEGETGIFITPGFHFGAVDAMLTNFHLPRSTLLAMVMAFTGITEARSIYQEAIRHRYRFYSFGDAVLIL